MPTDARLDQERLVVVRRLKDALAGYREWTGRWASGAVGPQMTRLIDSDRDLDTLVVTWPCDGVDRFVDLDVCERALGAYMDAVCEGTGAVRFRWDGDDCA